MRKGIVFIAVWMFIGIGAFAQTFKMQPNLDWLIGRPDITIVDRGAAAVSSATLNVPRGVALDVANAKMYVADTENNRILRYAYPVLSANPAPEMVFGQVDFSSATPGAALNGLNNPYGLEVDATGRLWVSDGWNFRVLYFDAAYAITGNQPTANGVITGFTTSTTSPSPRGLTFDKYGNLFVAGYKDRAVLRFDNMAAAPSTTTKSAASATFVLSGLKPIDVAVEDTTETVLIAYRSQAVIYYAQNASLGGSTADTFWGNKIGSGGNVVISSVSGVEIDKYENLYVVDANNSRVLVFYDFDKKIVSATPNDADAVIGQPDFTTTSAPWAGTGANTIDLSASLSSLAFDNVNYRLYFTDTRLHRLNGFQGTPAPVSLPIELSNFEVHKQEGVHVVTWTTSTETNNDYFTVEKSKNGKMYEEVTLLEGAGNSSEKTSYSTLDFTPWEGVTYYRLKQTDYDGKSTFSSVISVKNEGKKGANLSTVNVYPNPSNDGNVNIVLTGYGKEKEVLLVIRDVTGKEYFSKMLVTDVDGSFYSEIEKGNKLAAGIYVVTGSSQNNLYSKRLIVR